MKNLLWIVLALFLFSCNEKGFKTYDVENYLAFTKDFTKDSTIVSFFFHPGESELDVPLEVTLAGIPLREARTFTLVAVKDETDIDAANYQLSESYTFRSGMVKDTIYVHVVNSEVLKAKAFKLVLEIQGNDDFVPGVSSFRKTKLVISDIAAQPDWWTSVVIKSYLGKYSDKKYQLLIEVTGESDFSACTPSEFTAYALQLKYYLQKHIDAGNPPIYDEDNNENMKVTVIG